MPEHDNLSIVHAMYAAFGRGDVPTLLNGMDDAIEWQAVIGAGSHVPTTGMRRGKPAVAEFFQTLGQAVAFNRFEPREFIAQGAQVVALGEYEGRAISTGRVYVAEWAMVFTFKDGKLVRFREYAGSDSIDAVFDR
jgi:uncharacterized protein